MKAAAPPLGTASRTGAAYRAQPDFAPRHPLAQQRGDAHRDRGRDLDRLQHDAVGDRVGRGDVEAAGEDGDARRLEDADFDGAAGSTAVTLTAKSTPAAAAMPACWRPSATSST